MRFWGVTVGLILLALLAGLVLPAFDFEFDCRPCWLFQRHRHSHGERSPSTSLKSLTSAQADFRANDRDGDGINQFWRADIAGLYALAPGGGKGVEPRD